MGMMCARCGGVFRGRWAHYLQWCTVDEMYVCGRCWKWECHDGHGEGQAGAKESPGRVWVVIVVACLFLLLPGAWVLVDGARIAWYASLPVTPVAELPAEGVVKVQGTIESVPVIAWGGQEVLGGGDEWTWAWSTTDTFRVVDGTGGINVTTDRWWIVENSNHPVGIRGVGTVYLPGDAVLLVGEITGAGGERRLEVLYASPGGFHADPWVPLLLGSLAVSPFVYASARLGGASLRRSSLQREKTQLVAPVELVPDRVVRDEALQWDPMPRWTYGERLTAALACAVVGVVSIVVIWILYRPHDRMTLDGFVIAASLILEFLVLGPALGATLGSIKPTAMALSERGIHFWYPSPYARRLATGFVAWDEIEFLGMRKVGDGMQRVLERKGGIREDVGFLPEPLWKGLLSTWERRQHPYPTVQQTLWGGA